MKIKNIGGILFLFHFSVSGQVGINTTDPNHSFDLELAFVNKTLLLNQIAKVTNVANPVNGMLLYDKEYECFKDYANGEYIDCFGLMLYK